MEKRRGKVKAKAEDSGRNSEEAPKRARAGAAGACGAARPAGLVGCTYTMREPSNRTPTQRARAKTK